MAHDPEACAECPLPTSPQTEQISRKNISFGPLRKKENGHLYYATAALPGGPQLNVGDITLIPFQEAGLGEASGEVRNSLLADEALAEIHSIWYCKKNRMPYTEVRWYFRPDELMDEVTGTPPPRHHMIKGNVYDEIPLHSCRARCAVRQKAVQPEILEEREQRQVVASMYLDQNDTLRPQQFEFILFPTAKALARSSQYQPRGTRPRRSRSRSRRSAGSGAASMLTSPTAEADVFTRAVARERRARGRSERDEGEKDEGGDGTAKRAKLTARARRGGRHRREDEEDEEDEEGEEQGGHARKRRKDAEQVRGKPGDAQRQQQQQQDEGGGKSTGNIFSLLMRKSSAGVKDEAGRREGERRSRPRQREDEEDEETQRDEDVQEEDEEKDDEVLLPPTRARGRRRRPIARIDDSEEEEEQEEEQEEEKEEEGEGEGEQEQQKKKQQHKETERKAAKRAVEEEEAGVIEEKEEEEEEDVIVSQPSRGPRVVFVDSDEEDEAHTPYRPVRQPEAEAAARDRSPGDTIFGDTSDESDDDSSSDGLDAGLPEEFGLAANNESTSSARGAAPEGAGDDDDEGDGAGGDDEEKEDEEEAEETVVNGEPLADTSLSSFVERQLAGEGAGSTDKERALAARFKPAVDFVWRLTHAALSRRDSSDSTKNNKSTPARK